jgi:hypothetical protein
MRYVLTVLLLCSSLAVAKDRRWIDAKFTNVTDETNNAGTLIMPIGNGLAGVPMSVRWTYYRFDTPTMVYILAIRNKAPLNLTMNGMTKIAIEGTNGYIRDDGGKEKKMKLASKRLIEAPK